MDDYSAKKNVENFVSICRIVKSNGKNYADRFRAPIATFFYCQNLSTSPI